MTQQMETVDCPVCKCTLCSSRVRFSGDIVTCANCGIVYLRTRPTVAELEKQYQVYASTPGSHMKLPETMRELKSTGLRRNDVMSDVLSFTGADRRRFFDIGSGWGAFLLNAREHGFSVNGCEICKEMAEFAFQVLGIYTHASQLEAIDLSNESIQVVSLLHSLEHLPDTATALSYIHRILEPGGLICGIVPNFDSWASQQHKDKWVWLDPVVHYLHFTPETLKKTLWQFGFSMQKLYTATGDYDRNLLPAAPILAKLEKDGKGEEIRFFAQKI